MLISIATEKVFINVNIKYCIWLFKRALEIKKKKKKKKIKKKKKKKKKKNYVIIKLKK